jgi:predicted acyltransferase
LIDAIAGHEADAQVIAPPDRARLTSIDLLRGLTIGFMILANNNGGEQAFWIFKHADWNGFTPTDLVFPTFLFLVGVSAAISTAARLEHGASRASLFVHALRRSAILFLLGVVVNSFPFFHLDVMRFYGVLQRIAICYLIAVSLLLIGAGWRSKLFMIAAALVGYWLLTCFVPVPGYGLPGRDVPLLDPDGNLAAWLDRQIFPASHLYEQTRDPEGLLSTMPAIATTLIGLLAGCWLRHDRSLAQKIAGLAAAGVVCVLLGALWNVAFPINKKLWTSSYVLFAGGWSLLLLAGFLWTEVRRGGGGDRKKPAWQMPLLVFGTNAIVAYMFSELLASSLWSIPLRDNLSLQQMFIETAARATPDAAVGALIYSSLFTTVCWLMIHALYRRRLFIKI